ncbi:MAG: type II toxin-antitoxin system HicB family antitoxin [Luteolibacter sp.]|uniref:type II toxin-antitoxin system HicB family antitoxin n=1 Tax=Luteolibacter sp. TaxID=1962973 RepID=UPI003265A8D1
MRKVHYTLYREESDYVAQCLDFDVSSFGATKEEALLMLKEAVELYLEDDGTSEPAPRISEITVGEMAIA